MDESMKRRERLKAMRMEASQAEGSNSIEASSGSGCLSNPLIEISAPLPAHDFSATPRFDYYTDPLSAFSGNKKRSMPDSRDYPMPPSNVGSSMMQFSLSDQGAWNPAMAPTAHQLHSNYMHGPRMYPPQELPYNSGPRVPMGNPFPPRMYPPQALPYNSGPRVPMGNPFPMHPPDQFPPNPPYPNHGLVQMGRPRLSSGEGRGNWLSRSPGPDSGRGGYASHSLGRGRDHQFADRGGYARHSSGRGRDHQFADRGGYASHSSGRGRDHQFADRGGDPGPERLYNKSMVEDPWEFCEPVKWKSVDAHPGSSESWLPESIRLEISRGSETCNKSGSGPSLAESLAASLYETDNENDKSGT